MYSLNTVDQETISEMEHPICLLHFNLNNSHNLAIISLGGVPTDPSRHIGNARSRHISMM